MNEHNPPKERRMATTPELYAQLVTAFAEAEVSDRHLAKIAKKVVKGIILNGDASALGALAQQQLQHEVEMLTHQMCYDKLTLHKKLYDLAQSLGIADTSPTPTGDDEIVVNSTGR